MTLDSTALRWELRQAGVTSDAIDAVWPEWWTEAADASPSASAELRFTLARRLGLSPRSLFDGPPRFLWRDRAKYKNLGTASPEEVGILTSFGVAVAQSLLLAVPEHRPLPKSALELRAAVLQTGEVVGLGDLVAFCWAVGVPIVQLRLFPLAQKRMHAMTIRLDDRFTILLGREVSYPAQAAYMVAHEIGHAVLRHAAGEAAVLDVDDPLEMSALDDEEQAADRFALELLTGDPTVTVQATSEDYRPVDLAAAALSASRAKRVDPGVLALCLAHATGRWAEAVGALKVLSDGEIDVGGHINAIARHELDWDALALDAQDFLSKVMREGVAA